jgi:hypothetical protein
MRVPFLLAVVALVAAGCVSAPAPAPADPGAGDAARELSLPNGVLFHNIGQQAALSALHLAKGGPVKVAFPEGVLVQGEDGRLLPAAEPVEVAAGSSVTFLPPYSATNLTVQVDGQDVVVPLAEGERLVSGDLCVELLKVQRDQFPHRSPGNPSYTAAIEYFKAWFEAFGYEVEVLRYEGGNLPVGNLAPDSLSSVVAYKRGASDRILGFGGHFDVVEETRDGAFDNTAGTVATMAVAKAFANVTTEHTLVFGLWGGEEDGIVGSQSWLAHHPDLVPLFDGYVNFDVTAIAYPAPKPEPAGIVVATGPDGPAADALHRYAADIEATYLQSGATFVMEDVARGQATGAGVNAQSDHTPFMQRGIPVYFQFTERVNDVFAIIHSDVDTVDNLTKYALLGLEGVSDDVVLDAAQVKEGEWYLARSFETQTYLAFYYALLTDAGVLPVPSGPGALPLPAAPAHAEPPAPLVA